MGQHIYYNVHYNFTGMNLVRQLTHGDKMIPIPAMVYFINDPDSQRSGRGMGGPTTLKVGEALYKICPFTIALFEKKISPNMLCGMSQNFPKFFV